MGNICLPPLLGKDDPRDSFKRSSKWLCIGNGKNLPSIYWKVTGSIVLSQSTGYPFKKFSTQRIIQLSGLPFLGQENWTVGIALDRVKCTISKD